MTKHLDFNIVTFHTAYNYGAILQAYALKTFINELGYNSGIYDYRPFYKKSYSGLKGKLSHIVEKKDTLVRERMQERFDSFCNAHLNLNTDLDSRVFLAGSDQVWNVTGGINKMFFLDFVGDNSYRASYAASMGVCKVPSALEDRFSELLNRFDSVSVREIDALNCVKKYYNEEVLEHVDPTLLLRKEQWSRISKPVEGVPSKYILVYVLHQSKIINKLVKWLSNEMQCKVVLIDTQGLTSHFIQHDVTVRDAGPSEFVWLIEHAESVITTSFHGTIFSLLFERELYPVVPAITSSRIDNLLNKCNLSGINEMTSPMTRRNETDWDTIHRMLDRERKRSKEYIESIYLNACQLKRVRKHDSVAAYASSFCSGCSACMSICPTSAVSMQLNSEGFYEPVIDKNACVHCGKCVEHCPLMQRNGRQIIGGYYGWSTDKNVIVNSSSGGAFTELASIILDNGGIVYGAAYSDDCRDVSIVSTDSHPIKHLQKSKYTVSAVNNSFVEIKKQLDEGRTVLFSGTPCQNAGLTSYLEHEYQNLIRVDFLCGGMSSLLFYKEHLQALEKQFGAKIKDIDFRPKNAGWGRQHIRIGFSDGRVYDRNSYLDSYFKCFVNEHISVREICLNCPFHPYHVSDITMADFWGYKEAGVKLNKEGMSMLIANTDIGNELIQKMESFNLQPLPYVTAGRSFRCHYYPGNRLQKRKQFFKLAEEVGFESAAKDMCPATYGEQIKKYIRNKLR